MDAFLDGLVTFLKALTEEVAKSLGEWLLLGVLSLLAAVLTRSLFWRGSVSIGQGAGRTSMSPIVLLLGLLCATIAVGSLGLGLYFREGLREPGEFYAWLGLIGGFALGALAMYIFSRHTWEWDAAGLRWRGAWRSVAMRWSDIAHFGKAMSGALYVRDGTGRKISWSPQYTLQPEALRHAVQTARPDLTLKPDWGAAPEP
jgi:hypothetical protein